MLFLIFSGGQLIIFIYLFSLMPNEILYLANQTSSLSRSFPRSIASASNNISWKLHTAYSFWAPRRPAFFMELLSTCAPPPDGCVALAEAVHLVPAKMITLDENHPTKTRALPHLSVFAEVPVPASAAQMLFPRLSSLFAAHGAETQYKNGAGTSGSLQALHLEPVN